MVFLEELVVACEQVRLVEPAVLIPLEDQVEQVVLTPLEGQVEPVVLVLLEDQGLPAEAVWRELERRYRH